MSRTYIITLRHTNPARGPLCATFIVSSYDHGRAIIKATDRYRETFGAPERGTSYGIRWVNCDFMIDHSARYIPLTEI